MARQTRTIVRGSSPTNSKPMTIPKRRTLPSAPPLEAAINEAEDETMLEPKWRHAKAGRVPRPMPKQVILGDFISANSFAILQRPEKSLAQTLEIPTPGGVAFGKKAANDTFATTPRTPIITTTTQCRSQSATTTTTTTTTTQSATTTQCRSQLQRTTKTTTNSFQALGGKGAPRRPTTTTAATAPDASPVLCIEEGTRIRSLPRPRKR